MQDDGSGGGKKVLLWVLGITLVLGVLCCGGGVYVFSWFKKEVGTAIQRAEGRPIPGSGIEASETRAVSGFQGIDAKGAMRIEVEQGDVFEVVVTGDDNLVPLVETHVGGDELNISTPFSYSETLPLVVTVRMPRLTSLEVDGSCVVDVRGLDGDGLDVDLSGAVECMIEGRVGDLGLDVSGAAEADLSGLTAKRARVDASGATDVRVRAEESLDVEASGSSSVRHAGEAEPAADTSGAASVTRE